MRTILGIVGSPRAGGNTHVLVAEALAAAAGRGAAVECVLLGERTIGECDGCHACWKAKPCPKADGMLELYPKIAAADAVILGTPVYWYGPTALMKAFIDRFVYFNCPGNRPGVAGKPAAIVVPFEESDEQTAALTVEFFERSLAYLEMPLAARLIVPGVTARGEVARRGDLLDQARRLGAALAGG